MTQVFVFDIKFGPWIADFLANLEYLVQMGDKITS